jgi:CRISPR-associated protein Cmr4
MSVETKTIGGFLGLHAQTSLHAGAGTALDTIDLPVQRERHTQWPTIPGTAIKGVLRDAARRYHDEGDLEQADKNEDVVMAFGPDRDEADKHAGALSFTDARLLAFPVRSLKGVYAWVSCPAVLARLHRDAAIVGLKPGWSVPTVGDNQAALCKDSIVDARGHAVLEEYDFTVVRTDATPVASWIAEKVLPASEAYAATRDRFAKAFVLLSDDDFTYFARHATEVTARIALDATTKTVKKGALFYQELVPAEALFYSIVIANASRGGLKARAEGVRRKLEELMPAVVQIGGDETTGKGLCATRLSWAEEG